MFRIVRFFLALPGVAFFCLAALAQTKECSVAQPRAFTEEQLAAIHGNLQQAQTLYNQKVALQPKDYELTAGLVRTLLAEQKVDEADSTVKGALAAVPQAVELLTALAEVQHRQGIPWDEQKTLDSALKADPCYARLHLVFARYYMFNSYYATAVREIKLAHQLDQYDPEIRRLWMAYLPLKQRIEELQKYLTEGNTDADGLKRGQRELALLQGRAENKGACHLTSTVTSTEIPFSTALMNRANYLRGWEMDVYLNNHSSRLQVAAGSSGIYLNRSVAEHAGLKPISSSEMGGSGTPDPKSGYLAYADSVRIGNLEFKSCVVQVSDARSGLENDGQIGTDVFSNFLVTIDFPREKLTLGPLPLYPGTQSPTLSLNTQEVSTSDESAEVASQKDTKHASPAAPMNGPHDRYIAPEMEKWTAVYRVGPRLIMPTTLNDQRLRLFLLDTRSQNTAVSPSAAREVTNVHSTNVFGTLRDSSGPMPVSSGEKIVFRFAHLQQEKDNVLSYDMSRFSRSLGTEISGFIGFDMLGLMAVKIDYRDGLMDFQYSADRVYQHSR